MLLQPAIRSSEMESSSYSFCVEAILIDMFRPAGRRSIFRSFRLNYYWNKGLKGFSHLSNYLIGRGVHYYKESDPVTVRKASAIRESSSSSAGTFFL